MESSWQLMILMALALGLRHGLDLDHLATIDAITRTMRKNQPLAKLVGVLFSLGHGLIVTAICLFIGSGLIEAQFPNWLGKFGNFVSIFFLVLFGGLNLWSVFKKNTSYPTGIQKYITVNRKYNAFMILMIGAMFAISFDTISQIALFSISASLLAGWLFSGLLGIVFTTGMMITDGLNGLVVSKIIRKADKKSQIFSRCLGIIISVFSLSIAVIKLFQT